MDEKGSSSLGDPLANLDDPVEKKLHFRFGAVPPSGSIRVVRPPLLAAGKGSWAYFDDCPGGRQKTTVDARDLDTFSFCINLGLMEAGDPVETVELPRDLYCGEFLELNPLDIQELLLFQRKYGRILGARSVKPLVREGRELFRPEPDGIVFAGGRKNVYHDQYEGIKASLALYESVPDEEYVAEVELIKLSAVSFREAIATVLDAQKTIRATTRVLRSDLGVPTKRDAFDARVASEYLAANLASSLPTVELVPEDMPAPPTDLISGVFQQLLRGLLGNEAYRKCANPECGKLFTPADHNRRRDTQYCSSECQERAKRLRYLSRHKKGSESR